MVNGFCQGTIEVNGFLMVFYIEPLLPMVFHILTIGINGFFNGFFIRYDGFSMVFYRWTIGIDGFSNGFSIRDNGFSMVFYCWTIGIDGFLPLNHWYQRFSNGFLPWKH